LILAGSGEATWTERGVDTVGRLLSAFDRGTDEAARCARVERLTRLGLGAASVAHDLRNLLSTALLECGALGDEDDQTAQRLRESLRDARALAHDFLESEGAPARERVRLEPILAREARAAAAERAVTVDVACPEQLEVLGRRDLVARVVRNLALNAVQASPRGARISLTARASELALELDVTDEGRGMDRAELLRLLEPGRSGRGGAGFGTSSVLACLARLGGTLLVESRPGGGTRCRVTLQLCPSEALGAIVVLHDDARGRRAWWRALGALGEWAVEAGDAREARAWIEGGVCRAIVAARGSAGAREVLRVAAEHGLAALECGVRATWPSHPDRSGLEGLQAALEARAARDASPREGRTMLGG
jgi:hypothetical protein